MAPGWRTSLTVAVLYGLYRVYAVVASPLTTPVYPEPVPRAAIQPGIPLPSHAADVARQYLPDAAWAADADIILNRGKEGFVYFDEHRRIEDDRQNKVRLKPFALVWFDPRRSDGQPYTVTCSTALIEFQDKFSLGRGDSQIGRIVGGAFEGDVRITGPDGLMLAGRDFVLSEKDGNLYSDYTVSFAYGPAPGRSQQIRGHAEQFEITLTTDDDSILGQDMPHIGGFERFVLRRNVLIDAVIEEGERLLPISIQSQDQFSYDVENLVATFNVNVEVSQPTNKPDQPKAFNRLSCDQLSLFLEPKPAGPSELAQTGPAEDAGIRTVAGSAPSSSRRIAGLDLNLQLRSLSANGREVLLTSDEHQLRGRMGDLRYDIPSRSVHMRDEEIVLVQVGSSWLKCPDIRLTHDEDSRIRSARLEGAGQAWQTNAQTGAIELETTWSERSAMFPDPNSEWDLLELHGDARVVQRQQEMGVIGDVIRVWFDGRELQDSREGMWGGGESAGAMSNLPLRRVVAEQTGKSPVAMESPSLQLETRRLEAVFLEATGTAQAAQSPNGGNPFSPSPAAGKHETPVVVKAGEVRAAIHVDLTTENLTAENLQVSQLRASRDVRISRVPAERRDGVPLAAADGPFFVECETLDLKNDAGGQVLRLQGPQGAPARIQLPDQAEIEGNDLLVNRTTNEAQVAGAGTIAILVDRDLEGNILETPKPLTVRWHQQMVFDGANAKFLGNVETRILSNMIQCAEMDVTLNRRIDFSAEHPQTENLEISIIHGQGSVVGEFHEFEERDSRPTLVGFRTLEVAEFHFDQSTGKFSALGPGEVDDWRRGDRQQRLGLGTSTITRANQGVEADKREWSYTRLDFDGELNGNQIDRFLVLNDRVKVMHGPVERALQKIKRNDFSDDPGSVKEAAFLRSDKMNLQLVSDGSPESKEWLNIVAFGDAELEGAQFGARADSISYDQSKEQFKLNGMGTEAVIWYQKSPGAQPRENYSKTIQFTLSEEFLIKELILDKSSGFHISQ